MKYLLRIILLLTFIFTINSAVVYGTELPEITAKSAITIDVNTKEIIFSKDMDSRRYPASTTKLMTAIILAKNKSETDLLSYTKNSKAQEPFTIDYNIKNLTIGDKINCSQSMDAMLLCSANDIAYMIGENLGNGNISTFADMMNKEVEALGLKNTHFVNPNGLPNSNHYTSAYDLCVIARDAYNYPWVMNTLAKQKSSIKTQSGVEISFDNKNKLLNVGGCVGGKTGYTIDAGRCLVAYFERNSRKMVGVVLKSDYNEKDTAVFDDMKKIVDWSYSAEKKSFIKKNTELKEGSYKYSVLPMNLGPFKEVKVSFSSKEDFNLYKSEDNYKTEFNISEIDPWKLDKNTAVGTMDITSRETSKTLELYPSISSKDIFNANSTFYIELCMLIIGSLLILITVTLIVFFKVKKHRNKAPY